MNKKSHAILESVIDTNIKLSLDQLCDAIDASNDFITQLIEQDLIRPSGTQIQDWQFDHICYKRAKKANSFYKDLEVNMPGIALALDLLDKIERLEAMIKK